MECKFTHIFHFCNTGIKKKSNNFQKENDHKSTSRKSTGYYAAIHGRVSYPEGGQNMMFSRTKAHSTQGWALFGKQVPFSEQSPKESQPNTDGGSQQIVKGLHLDCLYCPMAEDRLKIVKLGITLPDYQSYSLFSAAINSLIINNHLIQNELFED